MLHAWWQNPHTRPGGAHCILGLALTGTRADQSVCFRRTRQLISCNDLLHEHGQKPGILSIDLAESADPDKFDQLTLISSSKHQVVVTLLG